MSTEMLMKIENVLLKRNSNENGAAALSLRLFVTLDLWQ